MFQSSDSVRQIWAVCEPELREQGYELVELESVGGPGGSRIFRFYIDKQGGGIGLNDCTAASQLLGPVLDREETLGENYCLEVSSPGFDRPIRKREDFARFVGEPVKLQTHSAVDGRKRFTGILKGLQGDFVAVECDGALVNIHLDNLKKSNLDR